jgi:hypothetical protein
MHPSFLTPRFYLLKVIILWIGMEE